MSISAGRVFGMLIFYGFPLIGLLIGMTVWGVSVCPAEILLLSEPLSAKYKVTLINRYAVDGDVRNLTLSFVKPHDSLDVSYSQIIHDYSVSSDRRFAEKKRVKTPDNADVTQIDFNESYKSIEVVRSFYVEAERPTPGSIGNAFSPMSNIPGYVERYLEETDYCQMSNMEIRRLSRGLADNSANQEQVVATILNWVLDNITRSPRGRYRDAVSAFNARSGDSAGIANLTAALLRNIGVPTRVVSGISVDNRWTVICDDVMWRPVAAAGMHFWIEIYYPGYGWVASDPLQCRNFVSPYYVKLAVGRDSREAGVDGSAFWTGTGSVDPQYEIQVFMEKEAEVKTVERFSTRPRNPVLVMPVRNYVYRNLKSMPAKSHQTFFDPARIQLEDLARLTVVSGEMIGLKNQCGDPPLQIPEVEGRKTASIGSLTPAFEFSIKKNMLYQQVVIDFPMKINHIAVELTSGGSALKNAAIQLLKDDKGKPGEMEAVSGELSLGESCGADYGVYYARFTERASLIMPGVYWLGFETTENQEIGWHAVPGNPVGHAFDTLMIAENGSCYVLNCDFGFSIEGDIWRPGNKRLD